MNFRLEAYAIQDIGQRSNQEDSFFPPFIDPCHYDEIEREWSFYDGTAHTDDRLFILCDGMGGHDRGEVASRIVTQTMSQSLLQSASIEGAFNDDMLHSAVTLSLQALAAKDDPKEIMKMGTTMTVLKFHADGATIGHIGDSRVYHFRPAQQSQPAQMLFCTEDHTVINEMVHNGQMTLAQARHSSKKHVLSRAMMSYQEREPELDIHHVTDIQTGDVFMLCSDGIFENLDDETLCHLVTDPNYSDVQHAQHLLHECKDNRDNRTAIIVRVVDILNTPDKMAPNASLTPGTVLQSKNYTYHIERVLGHGAFGITYLVNTSISMQGQLGTIHTGVKVALKEFYMDKEMKRVGSELVTTTSAEHVEAFAKKFRREAMKLAMLSHPNIVRVLEVFEANNTIYYAMEYLPDGSLSEYVNRKGYLREQEAIGCIRQIASALMYMHTNKMLHLDVKPANIMRIESTNTLKIIDFGLAKRFGENGDPETSANLGFGTPGYASLEQVDGNIEHDFSPELDVYALGATYYKLLTGLTPNSAIDVLNRGINVLPLVKKNVSQQSIDAIRAAMEPTKAKRLKTIEAFLNMLPRVDDTTIFSEKKKNHFWYGIIASIVVTVVAVIALVYIFRTPSSDDAQIDNAVATEAGSRITNYDFGMVRIEGGTFLMGTDDRQNPDAEPDEQPQHKVTVSTFSMSRYEVTQALWNAVMNDTHIAKSKNAEYPIVGITWDDVQQFLKLLNKKTGRHFRLPTEAEWEYAARQLDADAPLDSMAWYEGNSGGRLHPVGKLRPNALGLYDMNGNAWEYCSDWYGDYTSDALNNPKGPSAGDYHVVRGGSWSSTAHNLRPTYRQDNSMPTLDISFRLVEGK